jgi:hypothetical protein
MKNDLHASELEIAQAMAAFLASNAPRQCGTIADRKQARAARIESAQAQRARDMAKDANERAARRAALAERNAENKRYDAEGVWYVGGFQTE